MENEKMAKELSGFKDALNAYINAGKPLTYKELLVINIKKLYVQLVVIIIVCGITEAFYLIHGPGDWGIIARTCFGICLLASAGFIMYFILCIYLVWRWSRKHGRKGNF